MVFKEYYPFSRGKVCPIDQLLGLIRRNNCNYLYLIELLSRGCTSYYKTDTHWSSKAAMDVFFRILNKFSIDYGNFEYSLDFDFEFQRRVGDLGSKLNLSKIDREHVAKYLCSNRNDLFDKYMKRYSDLLCESV